MEVELLAYDAGKVVKMQRRLVAQAMEMDMTKRVLEAKETEIKEKGYNFGHLKLELESARAAISRVAKVMRDFIEWARARYMSLMCVRTQSYRDFFNVALGDAQLRVKYLGINPIPVGENNYARHVGETDRDGESNGSIPPP